MKPRVPCAQKEYYLLAEVGTSYDPDFIVLCYMLNDAVPTAIFPLDALLISAPKPFGDLLQGAYDSSYLLRFVRVKRKRDYLKLKPLDYGALYDNHAPGWLESRAYLVSMRRLARERGIPFLVLICPELVRLDEGHPYLETCETIRNFCLQEGIQCEMLFPYFEGWMASELWTTPTDRQPNRDGHAVIARALLEMLK